MHRGQQPRRIGDRAVIAEHHIIAGTGGDAIRADAADEDCFAGARDDHIVAAEGWVGGLCQAEETGGIEEGAVVTDGHIGPGPHGDAVCADPADDDLIAGAKHDHIIAARCRRIRCGTGQNAGIPGNRAVVSQHDVIARTGRDAVRPGAADDGAVADPEGETIRTAETGVGCFGEAQQSRSEDEAAGVADEDRGTRACRERVSADPRDDDLVAGAKRNRVIAARRRGIRGHARQNTGGPGNRAVVSQHDVIACTGGDAVRPGAAEDDAVADAEGQHIRAAISRIGGLSEAQYARRVEEAAIVAEDNVGTGTDLDRVCPHAADDDLVAGAEGDHVADARSRGIRCHADQDAGSPGNRAVVAQHDIVAGPGRDAVRAGPADDDLVAGAEADGVVASNARRRRLCRGQNAREEAQSAAIAKHDVIAIARRDPIGAGSAEDDVVARAQGDLIARAAERDRPREDDDRACGEQVVDTTELGHRPIIAEDGRIAGAIDDAVGCGCQRIGAARHVRRSRGADDAEGLDRQAQPGGQIDLQAAVAEQDVVAAPTSERVGAAAAGEPIRTERALQRIAAAAAIEHDGVGCCAGVEQVVSSAGEPARGAGQVRGRRVVEAAVLAGFSEQHERGTKGAAGRDQMVAPAAALDQRDRSGRGGRGGECIPARAKHDIDDLHAVIGDAGIERDQRGHLGRAEIDLGCRGEIEARYGGVARKRDTARRDLVAGGNAGERGRGCQEAGIARGAAIVEQVEGVGLRALVIDHRDNRQGAGRLAREHHGGGNGNGCSGAALHQHDALHCRQRMRLGGHRDHGLGGHHARGGTRGHLHDERG